MAKGPSIVVSEEAFGCVQLFSSVTGVPIHRVVSDALIFWWGAYGELILRAEEERAAYFDDNPGMSEEDYLKWMRMRLWPN
ncbi:MAG: hypothetical protein FWD64_09550 [Acidobacteriaceae bacterium]|nr:hypothetical protein [Acidobacteriaceae bacterium]